MQTRSCLIKGSAPVAMEGAGGEKQQRGAEYWGREMLDYQSANAFIILAASQEGGNVDTLNPNLWPHLTLYVKGAVSLCGRYSSIPTTSSNARSADVESEPRSRIMPFK